MGCDAGAQVTPEKRAQAKQMAYGLLYGMGKHALARSMGVPPDAAQQLSDSFRASIPGLVRLLPGSRAAPQLTSRCCMPHRSYVAVLTML